MVMRNSFVGHWQAAPEEFIGTFTGWLNDWRAAWAAQTDVFRATIDELQPVDAAETLWQGQQLADRTEETTAGQVFDTLQAMLGKLTVTPPSSLEVLDFTGFLRKRKGENVLQGKKK